jgi:hypothetical protein
MCNGGGAPAPVEAPPPSAPVESAELKVGEDTLNKKKKKGTSKLTVPIKKNAPTTGLAVPKVT